MEIMVYTLLWVMQDLYQPYLQDLTTPGSQGLTGFLDSGSSFPYRFGPDLF